MNLNFIKRIHLDIKKPTLPVRFDDSGETLMIAEQIAVRSVEQIEDAIVREITHMALEEGIDRVYLLDKKNIVSALKKQIPKKPSRTDKARCIHCGCVVKRDERFCKNCGQALKWRDSE